MIVKKQFIVTFIVKNKKILSPLKCGKKTSKIDRGRRGRSRRTGTRTRQKNFYLLKKKSFLPKKKSGSTIQKKCFFFVLHESDSAKYCRISGIHSKYYNFFFIGTISMKKFLVRQKHLICLFSNFF